MLEQGQSFTWSRSFTPEDVRAFSLISGDEGEHHVIPDSLGRLMVQGLLTATLPSKIGGEINFIANDMTFNFSQPVWTGDTITCVVRIDELEALEGRTRLRCSWRCTNQQGEVVMTGAGSGIIRAQAGKWRP
jgi:acyl dehydratase